MIPADVAAELTRHGARIVVAGDTVTLRFPPDRPPPPELVATARGHKAALHAFVVASDLRDGLALLADMPPLAGYSPRRWTYSGCIRSRRPLGTIVKASPGCSSVAEWWNSRRKRQRFARRPGACCAF